MVLEVGVLAETARTDVALERPRAAMYVHVRFQVSRRRERLGTQSALVRFLLFVFFPHFWQQHRKEKEERNLLSYVVLFHSS